MAGKEAASSSVLRLRPDRVQCMVCHKCGLCCAARKHEVKPDMTKNLSKLEDSLGRQVEEEV